MSDTEIVEVNLQASNIDQEGNVLYLDKERLDRKEVGFTEYKTRRRGLGFVDFIKTHFTYATPSRMWIIHRIYHLVLKYAKWTKKGGIRAKFYKKLTMIPSETKSHTGTVVMPLNVDLTDESTKVTVPMDLALDAIDNAEYIAGMDTCLCREANGCKDYPSDLACLLFGELGRTVVRHGIGKQITPEEAKARVERARELGLAAQAVWIDIEQFIWGVKNEDMDKFLEICFCCPCCCVGMRLARNVSDKERVRFHPAGWTAVPDRTRCVGCGKCVNMKNGCPMEAISLDEGGKVVIDQEKCIGCGYCRAECKFDVIKIKQTMPMRSDIHEYFKRDFNIDVRVWGDKYDGKTGENS